MRKSYNNKKIDRGNGNANETNRSSESRGNNSCCGIDEIHLAEEKEEVEVEVEGDEEVVVTVKYREESVQLHLTSGIQFNEFDCWVRSRFALPQDTYQVLYFNERNEECLPTFLSLDSQQSTTYINIQSKNIQSKSSKASQSPASPSSQLPSSASINQWWLKYLSFSYIFPIFSFIFIIVFVAPSSPIPNPMRSSSFFSPLFSFLGIEKEAQPSLYREMICTFMTWPVPYFFIRRAMNPDFGFAISFAKFGSDSFWGACAASLLVLLRHFVKVRLSTGLS